MNIKPLSPALGGNPGQNLGNIEVGGRSASADKLANAKAIAAGERPPMRMSQADLPVDPQVERIQRNTRSIKMQSDYSPDRNIGQEQVIDQQEDPNSAISGDNEQTPVVPEATKPLSPQFAALAKQRRQLQVKEAELVKREEALKSQANPGIDLQRVKANPLSVLQEAGVTYEQLTEAILANQGTNPEIQALREEIKALKEGVDQTFQGQETRQEEAALTQMLEEAEDLAKEGDTYEMIRERDAYDRVLRLIHGTYKKNGTVLDVADAMNQVETQLLEESLKLANIKKVQSKLAPADVQPQQQQAQRPQMRTLTSRDGARPALSKRERAIMAMQGTLKK